MQKTFKSLMAAFLAVGMLGTSAMAERPAGESKERSTNSLSKINGTPRYQLLNINNLWTWYRSDGQSSHSPKADDGTYFPRGTGSSDYQNGVMWGAKCYADAALTQPAPNGQLIRVGGANYEVGTREGRIIGSGATAVAASPSDADTRIYRVRRDYTIMTADELRRDAQETNELQNVNDVTDAMVNTIKDQYAADWANWPVQYGAPYIDRNGNGQYDAPPAFSDNFKVENLIAGNYDEPGVAGADPNSPADQVVWTVFNDLDANSTLRLQGSEPMGLEIQVTIWGYKRTDALGNIYFKRVKLINKGGVVVDAAGNKGSFYLDEVYVAQWADIDLGNAGDDISGCDVALGMGFTYNGQAVDTEYRGFKLPPPAVGFDFLAGPIVPAPGKTAVFDLKRINDFENLPMTSFSYFSAGAPISDPPRSYTQGTLRWYKMLRGFAPKDGDVDEFYPFPPGVTPDKFPLSGDPIAKTGFLDGLGQQYSFAPGDRRINLSTGPFKLSPGETQEFTVAYVAGMGADRLSSVAVMKFNDRFAQNTYNAVFQVPKPPSAPIVEVGELDGQVILQWGGNAARVADTETKVNEPGTYRFEGYNLYQFPSRGASLSEATRVVTYDLTADPTVILDEQFDVSSGQVLFKPVAFGTNSGITRIFSTTRDFVRDIDKLYNGQEYYFAVTAYSRATQAGFLPAYLESEPTIITVIPKVPFGAQLTAAQGDTAAKATHVTGGSDGNAVPIVSDPSKLTGHTYEVTFADNGAGGTNWTLKDVTANRVALADQTNQSGDDNYLFTDGFQLRVTGAPNSFKNFLVTANGAGKLDPPEIGCFAFNDNGFPFFNGADRPSENQQVGAGEWGIHTADDANGTRAAFSVFLTRVSNSGGNWPRIIPQDWEVRFTEAGGYAHDVYQTGKTFKVPFEIWRIGDSRKNDPSDDVRFIPHLLDDDESGTFNLPKAHINGGAEHSVSGGDNDPYSDWIYFATPTNETPGDAGYKAWEAAELAQEGSGEALIANETLRRVVFVNWNGGSVSDASYPANLNQALPETGTIFQIITTKPNTVEDKFTFTTAAPTVTAESQKASANDIGVYPNPYYAFNPAETNSLNRFVTFNNLPPNAKIRIFNLAGQLVRTIDKTEAGNSSQFQRWDLLNTSGLPVATGMYIAYIEATLPATGQAVSKVVKFAVIQEQEVLQVF